MTDGIEPGADRCPEHHLEDWSPQRRCLPRRLPTDDTDESAQQRAEQKRQDALGVV